MIPALQIKIVSIEVFRGGLHHRFPGRADGEIFLQFRHDLQRYLILHLEDILQVAVIILRPDMIAIDRVDQLRGYPDAFAGSSHATLEYGGHAELVPDLSHVFLLAFKRKRRGACRHLQAFDLCQSDEDLFGDAVAEVFIFRIGAHVDEGKHGDALFGPGLYPNLCGRRDYQSLVGDSIYLDRSLYVLQVELSEWRGLDVALILHLIKHLIRDQNGSGHRQGLDARGQIDTVAEYAVLFERNVTGVQSNAERDLRFLLQFELNGDRRLDRIDGAPENAEGTIAI